MRQALLGAWRPIQRVQLFLILVLLCACSAPGVDSLREASLYASDAIRNAQSPEGAWYTLHTPGTIFTSPSQERSFTVPAFITGLLQPIEKQAELIDVVEKAEGFLRLQIEDTGLVRYLPGPADASNLPNDRCNMMDPDSDDTALAWSIAPLADEQALRSALETILAYETPAGLYQTWLAPTEGNLCIDREADIPNPADAGVQMHVMLFLSRYAPNRVEPLCESLRQNMYSQQIWVYYRLAPIVPIIRVPELERIGCTVDIPDERLEMGPAGQQIWIRAATQLSLMGGLQAPSRAEVFEVLSEISSEDFAIMHTSPPLAFHQDLTASRPRYYWSPELGYALWLRLYFAVLGADANQ